MHDMLMDIIFELSEAQQALIMFGSMVLMIVLAIPIPIAVAIGTAIGYFMMDLNLVQVALSMYTGVEPFPLVTVPLFVFAGSLMEQGGMARRIVNMAQSMIGNYTGSLGLVAVLGCAFFAALSGSGPATTAAIGAVMIPSMIKQKWDPAMGGAIAAAGGALGSLIPPSNLMIIYGIVAEQSIPRLFLAGFIPGFVATALLMFTVYIIAKKRNYVGDGAEFSWSSRVDSQGFEEWINRLLVNGTYPVLPWLAFSTLGAIIAESENDLETRKNIIAVSAIVFLVSITLSFSSQKPWALTEGDAVLTFFPATTFFIFVTAMFVLIAYELLLNNSNNEHINLNFLEASGRLTLTIYVLHFAILGVAAEYMMDQPRLSIAEAFAVTFAHTLIWIPLANLHQRYCPKISLEELLRRVSN